MQLARVRSDDASSVLGLRPGAVGECRLAGRGAASDSGWLSMPRRRVAPGLRLRHDAGGDVIIEVKTATAGLELRMRDETTGVGLQTALPSRAVRPRRAGYPHDLGADMVRDQARCARHRRESPLPSRKALRQSVDPAARRGWHHLDDADLPGTVRSRGQGRRATCARPHDRFDFW